MKISRRKEEYPGGIMKIPDKATFSLITSRHVACGCKKITLTLDLLLIIILFKNNIVSSYSKYVFNYNADLFTLSSNCSIVT